MKFILKDLSSDGRTTDAIITIENTNFDDYYIQTKIFEWVVEFNTSDELKNKYYYSYYYIKDKLKDEFNAIVNDVLEFGVLYY